jgi:nitrite reductase/ring-hydroxylating ferredoxin subunit
LKSLGAYTYLPGGNKGVILIHNFDDRFVAVERACTYNPDDECSRIYVDSVNLLLRCGSFNDTIWEPCCTSQFEYDGTLRAGPARCSLRPYGVTENGSTLNVFN